MFCHKKFKSFQITALGVFLFIRNPPVSLASKEKSALNEIILLTVEEKLKFSSLAFSIL
jgi:hypothetical protein